jgi:glucose-1-phosphate thymidylyltransferase
MKGIILAGGMGTRMLPLTKITNKHLLPVYDKPMIYYPIQILVNAGITDIMIVTGGESAGDFLKLLGNGKEFGLKHLNYTYQEGATGIAAALALTEHFADGDRITLILGDNVIEKNILKGVKDFEKQERGAKIYLTAVSNPQSYGIAELDRSRIIHIEEKPKTPKSNLAVIGIYMYDERVYDVVKTLKPSRRGELEITDVNNFYVAEGTMTYEMLDGWWGDCGESFKSMLDTANLIARNGANKID